MSILLHVSKLNTDVETFAYNTPRRTSNQYRKYGVTWFLQHLLVEFRLQYISGRKRLEKERITKIDPADNAVNI